MKSSTRIILIVTCSLLSIFLIGILVWGIIVGENIDKGVLKLVKEEQIAVKNIHEIIVEDNLADITIYRTDEEKIRVVQKSRKKLKEKELFQTTITDDTLKIEGKKKINFCFGFCFLSNPTYDIYIPNSYKDIIILESTSGDIVVDDIEKLTDLKARTVSGDITLKGDLSLENIELKTTSGDIEVSNISGSSILINTVSGDIDVNQLIGNATIKTTSGDISHNWLEGGAEVSTVSGDIRFGHWLLIGNSKLKSTSGDISLGLDSNSSVKMSADSVSGDIRFPHAESIIGDGKHSLSMKTTSGDIRVKIIN